ncbi:MAG: transposase, partial [Patescibacteria group bacterium]
MSRNFVFSEEEFYHCYGRGTEKRKIFLSKKDYERFLNLLFVCNSTKTIHLSDFKEKSFNEIFLLPRENTLIEIGAYCLMPNHFHFLLKEKQKDGISLFMQKTITAYTMY